MFKFGITFKPKFQGHSFVFATYSPQSGKLWFSDEKEQFINEWYIKPNLNETDVYRIISHEFPKAKIALMSNAVSGFTAQAAGSALAPILLLAGGGVAVYLLYKSFFKYDTKGNPN